MAEREHPKIMKMWHQLSDVYTKAHDGQAADTRDQIAQYVLERFRALDSNMSATGKEFEVSSSTIRRFISSDEILSQREAARRAMRRIYDDPQKKADYVVNHLHSPDARRNRGDALRRVKKGKRLSPYAYERSRQTLQAKADVTRQQMIELSERSPFPDEIAQETGKTVDNVSHLLRRLGLQYSHHAKSSSILKKGRNLAEEMGLGKHLDQMDARTRYIVQQRFLTKKPLSQVHIAKILFEKGYTDRLLTRERIRQIELVLIDRMQRLVDAGYPRRDIIKEE